MPNAPVISQSEAAARLGVDRSTVSRALRDGRLTPVQVVGRRAVKVDRHFRAFTPWETGQRVARRSVTT